MLHRNRELARVARRGTLDPHKVAKVSTAYKIERRAASNRRREWSMNLAKCIVAASAALALAGCGRSGAAPSPVPTQGVTDAMIAAADGSEWLTYGRDYAEQRFSPLTQVSDKTVGQLGLAWSADLDTARGQEATPLMHDGVLYVSTAWSKVNAYDAKTGALKWTYDPKVPRETLPV